MWTKSQVACAKVHSSSWNMAEWIVVERLPINNWVVANGFSDMQWCAHCTVKTLVDWPLYSDCIDCVSISLIPLKSFIHCQCQCFFRTAVYDIIKWFPHGRYFCIVGHIFTETYKNSAMSHRTCIFKTVKLFDFGERIVAFLSPGIDCVRIMIVTQIEVRVKESMSLSTETEICGNILKQEFSCITKHRYMSNVQHFLLKQ